MIKQRGDKMWIAHCDKPGCPEVTDSFLTYTDIMIDLMDKKWSFCDSKSPCFCQTCSEKFKEAKEKEKPVCAARDGEFKDNWFNFNSQTKRCPRARAKIPYYSPNLCPASNHAIWRIRFHPGDTTGKPHLTLERTPEFLSACSRCLGESQYSVVDENTKEELPPLHIGKGGVEIRVQQVNEKMCHSSCQFYLHRQYAPSWCNRHNELCLADYRCEGCLKEFPLGEVVDAEITVNVRVDALEKCVNKITEGYERMFGYLDIISKAVMTIIREKEEK